MWLEIEIGVLSSISATIIWYILSQLWKYEDRKIIDRELETALTSLHEIEQKTEYADDYNRILQQTDRMYDCLNRIFDTVKLFTYKLDFDRKKMILTIIWDNIRLCICSKNYIGGYSGTDEIIERARNIRKMIRDRNNNETDLSMNLTSLYIAKDLNRGLSLQESAARWLSPDSDLEHLTKILIGDTMIDVNSFNQGNETKTDIRYYCFSKNQYINYIKKQMNKKNRGNT